MTKNSWISSRAVERAAPTRSWMRASQNNTHPEELLRMVKPTRHDWIRMATRRVWQKPARGQTRGTRPNPLVATPVSEKSHLCPPLAGFHVTRWFEENGGEFDHETAMDWSTKRSTGLVSKMSATLGCGRRWGRGIAGSSGVRCGRAHSDGCASEAANDVWLRSHDGLPSPWEWFRTRT
jgi:hypothetical protein